MERGETPPALLVDVAVAIIEHEGKILLVYNEKWRCWTLPMTSRHVVPDPNDPGQTQKEDWQTAAQRAAAEALRKVPAQPPTCLFEVAEHLPSKRDDQWKRYKYRVFEFTPDTRPQLARGARVMRARKSAVCRGTTLRTSSTARLILAWLESMRLSMGALALIQRQDEVQGTLWLAQWNPRWNMYNFVGGHRGLDETWRGCVARKIKSELGLAVGRDCKVPKKPRTYLEYEDWSESAQQTSTYRMSVFDVHELTDKALQTIDSNSDNCWLTEDEVRHGQAADARPVSPTMLRILDALD